MKSNLKTPKGASSQATQRVNKGEYVPVSHEVSIRYGKFRIDVNVGDARGYEIVIDISLEEILAWLPELSESAINARVAQAENNMRSLAAREGNELGVVLPYLPGEAKPG